MSEVAVCCAFFCCLFCMHYGPEYANLGPVKVTTERIWFKDESEAGAYTHYVTYGSTQ